MVCVSMSPTPVGLRDPLLGRLVAGRFLVKRMVARGGMGAVYVAEQQPLGRACALKVLAPRYEGEVDAKFEERFFLEASTLAQLQHPNTVRVYDYGRDDDGTYFLAMELVDGEGLDAVIRREGKLVAERAVHLAVQVARSLREAHTLGVVHRDLKPGNLLVTNVGEEAEHVKVLDFGLVKAIGGDDRDLTHAGLFMGSPRYMSPEQIRGDTIDQRSDVYALGILLFQMLAGRTPFDGDPMRVLVAHASEPVPPLPTGVAPLAVERVIRRCLAKRADDRYLDMTEVIAALRTALAHAVAESGSVEMPLEVGADDPFESGVRTVDDPTPLVVRAKRRVVPTLAVAAAFGVGVAVAALVAARITSPPSARPAARERLVTAPAQAPSSVVTTAPLSVVRLHLHSNPEGADVMIGDRRFGTTPLDIEWPADRVPGGHVLGVDFRASGYRPAHLDIVVEGSELSATALLARVPRVRPDTITSGDAPLRLPPGYRDYPVEPAPRR